MVIMGGLLAHGVGLRVAQWGSSEMAQLTFGDGAIGLWDEALI